MTATSLAGRLFCSVQEAAQLLELDARTLRRAIEAGDFPAVRVAGTVRVPIAKLLALAGLNTPADGALVVSEILDGDNHASALPS